MKKLLIIVLCFVAANLNAQVTKTVKPSTQAKPAVPAERMVEIKTDYGTMIVKLYNATPQHRDNFIKLVKQKFYDSLLFHRVIDGFMIQGGDPQSKNADSAAMLGNGEAPGEMIPAEFKENLIHKKGALAMARTENPEKASSNCQFYVVQGQVFSDAQLNEIECRIRQTNPDFYYNDAKRKTYKTVGGTAFLDQNYTVFGEVTKGFDVIDKIAKMPRDENDRPLKNIRMKMRMLN